MPRVLLYDLGVSDLNVVAIDKVINGAIRRSKVATIRKVGKPTAGVWPVSLRDGWNDIKLVVNTSQFTLWLVRSASFGTQVFILARWQ